MSYAHDSAVVDRHRPVAVQLPHEHLVHAVVRHGPEQPRHDPDILVRVQARIHDAAQVLEHAVCLAIIELISVKLMASITGGTPPARQQSLLSPSAAQRSDAAQSPLALTGGSNARPSSLV